MGAAPIPIRGDATIWPAWVSHGVSPVTRGARKILVLEFWEFCSKPQSREIGRPAYDDYLDECKDENENDEDHEDDEDESENDEDEDDEEKEDEGRRRDDKPLRRTEL